MAQTAKLVHSNNTVAHMFIIVIFAPILICSYVKLVRLNKQRMKQNQIMLLQNISSAKLILTLLVFCGIHTQSSSAFELQFNLVHKNNIFGSAEIWLDVKENIFQQRKYLVIEVQRCGKVIIFMQKQLQFPCTALNSETELQ